MTRTLNLTCWTRDPNKRLSKKRRGCAGGIRLRRRGVGLVLRARRHVPKELEWDVALVLPQEVEEPLVVLGRHVEARDQQLVVAKCMLQAKPNHFPDVVSGQVARHERLVDRRPERFPSVDQPGEQRLWKARRRRLHTSRDIDHQRLPGLPDLERKGIDVESSLAAAQNEALGD